MEIVHVCKPPTSRKTSSGTPVFPHPCLYAGDFNCQHVNWDYRTTSPDGESLDGWVTKSNIALLHNPKDAPSFFSGRWNTGTNPDLAFASKSDGTFVKPNGKSLLAPPTGLLGIFHLRTLPVLMRPTKTSATPSSMQRKNQFHAVVGKTTDHARMRSVRPSTRHSLGHRRVKAVTQLPELLKGEGNAGQRQSMPSILCTQAGWHRMP